MTERPPPRYGKGFNIPMRIAVLFSGGASSGKAMLEDPEQGPGKKYQVVVAGTDRPKGARERGMKLFKEADVPVIDRLPKGRGGVSSSRKVYCEGFRYASRGGSNEEWIRRYWEAWSMALEPYRVDIVALSGLMILVDEPLLSEYRHRILNVHPAPLHILAGPGVDRLDVTGVNSEAAAEIVKRNRLRRKYKGEDAVYDAVVSGEPDTRSTVHFLADKSEDFDEGPIAVESKAFEIDREQVEKLGEREYTDKLQERMKWEGDGPAFTFAMRALAGGDLEFGRNCLLHKPSGGLERRDHCLLYKSEPLPYEGVQLK